jgi:hypothetical protein
VVGRNIVSLLDEVVHDVEAAALQRLSRRTIADLAAQAVRRG